MTVFTLDPLRDPRWSALVGRHPRASVFHTTGWLEALHRTYGYEPVAYTTSRPEEPLTNALVFCKIKSWLTGHRMVSLPFSDHCDPLVDTEEEWELLALSAWEGALREGCKYIEMRPLATEASPCHAGNATQSASFYLHTIDLRRELSEIHQAFHKSCVQRKIRRAEREGISSEQGRSPELLKQFYQLLLATRRRHRLPPQPPEWFASLVDCLGERVSIRVASKERRPIAGILTLSFRDRIYYKYGASDEAFHNLGGVQLLLWQTIQDGKQWGAQIFDMGRSDTGQASLANFKDHWGSNRSALLYYRYPCVSVEHRVGEWASGVARHAFVRLPDPLLITAGRFLYPHIG